MGSILSVRDEEPQSLRAVIRQNKRGLSTKSRRLQLEGLAMERKRKALAVRISAAAERNEIDTVKVLASDYARLKSHERKLMEMVSRMSTLSTRMDMLGSTAALNEALADLVVAMRQANSVMNLSAIQSIIDEYDSQQQHIALAQDITDEAMQDADALETEEHSDEIVARVLDEIGARIGGETPVAPSAPLEPQDLAARLERLQR
ncbi:Charged multivesicular body protein 2b [Hondaea fermentalgiana]|uniref:Charged multivesicular body protein 2b n=1 Tax=Hondaea fermentalgiana TaxID=2315210 RepID=A0A2R5GND0_9STRA|nr:Charged multivesicular body protein 2b [Hondaea fermentalgiana]|eukprot:GBG29811.1 Charged multivesicular body protein 2b [Hondaea fermentalgiana]